MTLSEAAANAAADAVTKQLDGGFLRVYAANRTLLVESRFSDPAFSPASGGSAKALSISTTRMKASGKADAYQALTAAGAEVFSGPASDLNLEDPALQEFGEFIVDSFTYKQQS